MKRNIIRIGLLCCLLLGVFAFSTAALADNGQPQLPKAGILPDSPFYFVNKIGRDISMFFTFGNQAKAEKALHYAGENLAAAKAEAAKGKDQYVADAVKGYENYMQQVAKRLESLSGNSTSANLSEQVALATGLHLTVLDALSGNLTGPAGDAIAHALQVSVNGQEQALKALARHHAEQALTIAGNTINAHLQELADRAGQGFSGNLTSGLNITDQLSQLEDQLAAAAQQQGINVTAIQQQLAQATSKRLATLSQVYNKVPEQAREAIQHAVENSFQMYQRAIDRLSSGNVTGISGNATLPQSALNQLGNLIRQRLGLNGTDNATGNLTLPHLNFRNLFSGNITGNLTLPHLNFGNLFSGNMTGNLTLPHLNFGNLFSGNMTGNLTLPHLNFRNLFSGNVTGNVTGRHPGGNAGFPGNFRHPAN